MNDKELLTLAAKAAGIELRWHIQPRDSDGIPDMMEPDDFCYIPHCKPPHNRRERDMEQGEIWNPLTDDGDALRLAVKLELNDER